MSEQASIDEALQGIDQWITGLQTLKEFLIRMKTQGEDAQENDAADVRLNVPWLSQLGATAAYAGGDCSMACVAMVLRGRGRNVTIDEVSRKSALKPGFTGAAWWDTQRAAAAFGLMLDHGYNLEMDDLASELRAGKPVIVILNYQSIPARLRYSNTYNQGHFVLVVGMDRDAVLMHDPFWPEGSTSGTYVEMPRADFLNAWNTLAPGNTLSRQVLRVKAW